MAPRFADNLWELNDIELTTYVVMDDGETRISSLDLNHCLRVTHEDSTFLRAQLVPADMDNLGEYLAPHNLEESVAKDSMKLELTGHTIRGTIGSGTCDVDLDQYISVRADGRIQFAHPQTGPSASKGVELITDIALKIGEVAGNGDFDIDDEYEDGYNQFLEDSGAALIKGQDEDEWLEGTEQSDGILYHVGS